MQKKALFLITIFPLFFSCKAAHKEQHIKLKDEEKVYINYSPNEGNRLLSLPIFVPGEKNILLSATDTIKAYFIDNPDKPSLQLSYFPKISKLHKDGYSITSIALSNNGDTIALTNGTDISIYSFQDLLTDLLTQESIPLYKIPITGNIKFDNNNNLLIAHENSISSYQFIPKTIVNLSEFLPQSINLCSKYEKFFQKNFPDKSITAISTNNQYAYYVPNEQKLFINNNDKIPMQCIHLENLINGTIVAIEFSPNEEYIVLTGTKGISVCKIKNTNTTEHWITNFDFTGSPAFYPMNNNIIFILCDDGTGIEAFDLRTQEEIYNQSIPNKMTLPAYRYNPPTHFKRLIFNANGKFLVAAFDFFCKVFKLPKETRNLLMPGNTQVITKAIEKKDLPTNHQTIKVNPFNNKGYTPKAVYGSFFIQHKNTILAYSLIGILGIVCASIMAYLHYELLPIRSILA